MEDPASAERHEWYRWLRHHDPVHHRPDGTWVVSRFADVTVALRDHRRFSSYFGNDHVGRHVDALPSMDPPEHTQVRRAVAAPFRPGRSREHAALVDAVVESASERFASTDRRVDAISGFATVVPATLLGSVVGVEARTLVALTSRGAPHRRAFLSQLVSQHSGAHRSDPPQDAGVLDHLVTSIGHAHLTDDDAVSFLMLLLAAGLDTVRDLIGEIVLLAISESGFWDDIRRRSDAAATVADELLRWVSPLQAVYRTTTEPVVLGDTTIPGQARVMLLLAAANRDERVWEQPDSLDLDRYDRSAAEHLAFGTGPHRCLGETLARMQLAAVLRTLPEHVAAFTAAGEPVRRPSPIVRGLQTLPVQVTARPRS